VTSFIQEEKLWRLEIEAACSIKRIPRDGKLAHWFLGISLIHGSEALLLIAAKQADALYA
jgi:hypothetical protein